MLGRRRPWTMARFAALDFETTGLDFARDRIISIGVVPVDRGVVLADRGEYRLVDPGRVPISAASTAIHGLTADDLRGAATADEARAALRRSLDRRFLLTWHGYVEAEFLGRLFGSSPRGWLRRSVDVRWLVLALLGDAGARSTLSEAAGRFDVPVTAPHHALDDALVTAHLFVETVTRLADDGVRTARDALRLGHPRGAAARRAVVPR